MRRSSALISLLAVAGSLGCAASEPILVPPPPRPWPTEVTPPKGEARPRGELPKHGEYVYVEELPEAVVKVAPQYPDAARAARVEGTVMVQALVGADGRVKDTFIVKSIPELDEAAAAAVRQWVFKPARGQDGNVAVWVAVPMKFELP